MHICFRYIAGLTLAVLLIWLSSSAKADEPDQKPEPRPSQVDNLPSSHDFSCGLYYLQGMLTGRSEGTTNGNNSLFFHGSNRGVECEYRHGWFGLQLGSGLVGQNFRVRHWEPAWDGSLSISTEGVYAGVALGIYLGDWDIWLEAARIESRMDGRTLHNLGGKVRGERLDITEFAQQHFDLFLHLNESRLKVRGGVKLNGRVRLNSELEWINLAFGGRVVPDETAEEILRGFHVYLHQDIMEKIRGSSINIFSFNPEVVITVGDRWLLSTKFLYGGKKLVGGIGLEDWTGGAELKVTYLLF